jgi:hypothetical protein
MLRHSWRACLGLPIIILMQMSSLRPAHAFRPPFMNIYRCRTALSPCPRTSLSAKRGGASACFASAGGYEGVGQGMSVSTRVQKLWELENAVQTRDFVRAQVRGAALASAIDFSAVAEIW